MSNTQKLIERDIRARQENRRGVVLTEPKTLNYDTAAIDRTVFVVDVDIGATRPVRDVVVKSSSGLGGRAYAQVGKAIEIQRYCDPLPIKPAFGIGTHFTNDFSRLTDGQTSKALNMVIKLWAVNGIPVVKTSDDAGKVMGDPDAVRVTRWMVDGTPLG